MNTATVRVMSPEEIGARGAAGPPALVLPAAARVFTERAKRLAQLARNGHPMSDYLAFMSALANAQQAALSAFGPVPLPDAAALDRAAQEGLPPLPAIDWPRDPAWLAALRSIAAAVMPMAPEPAQAVMQRLSVADEGWLERQADALLHSVMQGLDLAAAPVVAAALQVYWTHLVTATQARSRHDPDEARRGAPFGRIEEATQCPCCGSRPVASLVRSDGAMLGQRYLHCSLCSTQWHLQRIRCVHCGSAKGIAYQSLDLARGMAGSQPVGPVRRRDELEAGSRRAAQATVEAETCDECGHYLKILHAERDPFCEPVADDLATLTLDLLVAEAGLVRHGVNLMLLFGEPGAPPDPPVPTGGDGGP